MDTQKFKVQKKIKKIYIYTTNELISEGDNKTHIYTSSNKTEDIGSEKTDEKVSQLYKKYESKLKTYKHTFLVNCLFNSLI